VTPAFAEWYVHKSENYYKRQDYHNEKYGDFAADINEKIYGHMKTDEKQKIRKPQNESTHGLFDSNLTVPPGIQQAPNTGQH